jgi:hypothetical protein
MQIVTGNRIAITSMILLNTYRSATPASMKFLPGADAKFFYSVCCRGLSVRTQSPARSAKLRSNPIEGCLNWIGWELQLGS